MLSSLIESLLIFLANQLTHKAAQAQAGHPHANKGTGLFARLFRRPDPAPVPAAAAPADLPVIIGTSIPSAREALRHGSATPTAISLTTEERLRQIYGTGGTGAGKTTLWLNMIVADAIAERGVGIVDWRGETADLLLSLLAARYAPDELADRLLLLDLRASKDSENEQDYSVGFDPLAQGRDAYSQTMFVLDVLRQQFGSSLGPQTEELCRNIILAMALSPMRPPLADIEIFLTSQSARAELLVGVKDVTVLRFFARYDSLPESQRGQWISPVLNKVTPMLAQPALRRLMGDTNSISLQNFLDERPNAILIVCLAADELFSAASLIGTLIVSAIASSLMRSDRKNKHPFFLFLDEVQNLAGGQGGASEQLHTMISESRRFSLGLALSHQSTSQLNPKLRTLIRDVVATHFIFSTGGLDADLLAGELASEEPKAVLKQIILTQKPGEALLARRGKPTIRIKTHYAPPPNVPASLVQALRQACLRRHGRPVAEVDAEILAREELFLPSVSPQKEGGAAALRGVHAEARKRADPPHARTKKSSGTRGHEIQDLEVRDHYDK